MSTTGRRRRPKRVRVIVLATVSVAALATGCARERRPKHVLLISIDSLRADRLGCYGNPRETSPTIDRLAREGTRFAHAYSPAPWTLPSHATLLTGVPQRRHGALTAYHRIRPRTPRLASILEAAGRDTRGVYAGPYLAPLYGFSEGFDEYLSCETYRGEDQRKALQRSHSDQTNPCVRRVVARWAAEPADLPAFWFVHMWDVHFDYIPPARYVRRFDPRYHGELTGRKIQGRGFPLTASTRDVTHLLARYDGEIRYTDDTIRRMLEALEAAGRLDETLIVITSDHGEEFLEHRGKTHMRTVFAESVRVPLVLWGPGVPRGVVVDTPVALQDVAPTILDLVGMPATGMDGTSLRGLMENDTVEHPSVVSILYLQPAAAPRPEVLTMAIRSHRGTLLRPRQRSTWVAYDFEVDPLEQKPMPVVDPARVETAASMLRSARLGETSLDEGSAVTLPDDVRQRLEALGYLEKGRAVRTRTAAQPFPRVDVPAAER